MRRTLIATLLLCSAGAAPAQQDSGGLDFFQSSLTEILDTPLLAASYAEERPSDAAAAAYVVTAETIEKRGYETLVDLLGDMPQFQVQRNSDVRRLNLVSVRGVPDNERLIVLYDGVKVKPPTGDLFAFAGQLSLRDAERVEVVLGPMSSVYGADAFSGIVNVVSRAYGSPAAGLSYGSFNARSAGLSAKTKISDKDRPGAFAALTYEARDGASPKLPDHYRADYAWYRDQYRNSGLAQVSPYDSATTAVPVGPYDARENSSFLNGRLNLGGLELGLIKMKESHSSSIGVKPELTLYTKEARFATGYWTVFGRHAYSSPGENWRLNTLVSYFDYEISPESRFRNSFSSYGDAYKYAAAGTTFIEQTLSFEPVEDLPALLGYSYQESSVLPYTADLGHKFDPGMSPVSQNFVYTGSTIPVDFHTLGYSNTGAFLRLQRQLGHASLSLGLRYDHNTSYGETWNPRAGLVWRPGGSERTVVKLLYGEAFLAPSPFQAYKHFGSFVSSPTAPSGYHSYFFHVPNEDLKPEKVRSAEASLSHDLSAGLRFSVNPYYTKVRDLIQDVTSGAGVFHGVPVDTIERAENTGAMETYGATLKADGAWRSGRWSLQPWAAYTLSEGRLAGEPIPFNSRHVLQGGVSLLRGRWAITPKALYRSYTRNQDGGRVAPFTVLDLFVRYSRQNRAEPSFSAWLGLKNLLDRRYYHAAYGGGVDHLGGAPQTPFEASLGMEYRF